jgi:superfamily II DNA or RNA helicase
VITLRPDQLQAKRAIYAAWTAGHARVLQQAPTAWGKGTLATTILADVARQGKRAVFVAHLSEINADLVSRLRSHGVEPRLLMGSEAEGPADSLVWVVSEQTARRRGLDLSSARVVIRDECHRAAAHSHQIVSAAAPPDAWHLGLTATPERGDGRPLTFYSTLLPGPSPSTLVAQGIIAPIKTFAPARPGPELARDPVEVWPRRADGSPRPGVLFAKNIAHSQELAARFGRERGWAAVHVESDTPDRAIVIERFNAGDVQILCCLRLLCEGVDTRRSEVTTAATSFGHAGPMLQAIGRSRRMHPGKRGALFIDLTDNVSRHGLPDDDRVYALDGKPITLANDETLPPVAMCRQCHAWARAGRVCSACGHRLPPPPPPKLSKRELKEQMHAKQRRGGDEWEQWCLFVRERVAAGKTPGKITAAWMCGPGGGMAPRYTVAMALETANEERESA